MSVSGISETDISGTIPEVRLKVDMIPIHPTSNPMPVTLVHVIIIRAGKSTQLVYLSKSTSNSEKSYSSTSKSTQKKLYLKYK